MKATRAHSPSDRVRHPNQMRINPRRPVASALGDPMKKSTVAPGADTKGFGMGLLYTF